MLLLLHPHAALAALQAAACCRVRHHGLLLLLLLLHGWRMRGVMTSALRLRHSSRRRSCGPLAATSSCASAASRVGVPPHQEEQPDDLVGSARLLPLLLRPQPGRFLLQGGQGS